MKGLNSVGNKQELIERLQTAMSESSGELNEDDLLNVRFLFLEVDLVFHLEFLISRTTSWKKKNHFWIQHTTQY